MSENFNEKFYEVSEASKMPAAESETVEIKKESVEALQEETYTETPNSTKEQPKQLSSLGRYSEWFREREILKSFSPEQTRTIKERKNSLSSLAYFIGKNFSIQITLGLPSKENPSGWHWGKRKNGERYIQMNAHDLLEKPMDYLRYVASHEGGA